MHGVVDGDAKDAVVMLGRLLHSLDENPLARFEDVDGAPLEEADVGNLVASEEVATIIERHHRVARHAYEEVSPLVLELRDDVTLAVFYICASAPISRETGDGIEGNERNALTAALWHMACGQCQMLRLHICGIRGRCSFFLSLLLKHGPLTSKQPICINIELFSPKNFVINTENCIFAAHLRLNERPKIRKRRENNEF